MSAAPSFAQLSPAQLKAQKDRAAREAAARAQAERQRVVTRQRTAEAARRADAKWQAITGSDTSKLGLVFPEYSENEFTGIMLTCDRRTGIVDVYEFSDDDNKITQPAIHVRLDNQDLRLPARSVYNEMYDSWNNTAQLPYASQGVQRIVAARSFVLASSPSLVLKGFVAARDLWRQACGL
ncbi:MAG: hypothetical protein RSE14_10415 [Erythrobacter sp.]|uniref:hypothetical protein n=1 Tax=Erythrobacter sp. TaxID=1042 RepID=UPI002B46FCA2|nr:hypothetical protein [Erythrobacter sp.]WRH69690.1 MAG: hypothetical protein RSE14_10415 [Erythrobacter sp.]